MNLKKNCKDISELFDKTKDNNIHEEKINDNLD